MKAESQKEDDILLARALEKIQTLQRELDKSKDPVVIIGVGLSLPGGVACLDDLWGVLKNPQNLVGPIPESRWPVFPGENKFLGCVDQVFDFDPQYFGISPKETYHLDPQHRFLLMRAEEALSSAGIDPENLYQSNTGVFVGVGNTDYYQRIALLGDAEMDPYVASGNSPSMAAGRIAYHYGFKGPCASFDTACSSGLFAMVQASKSLENKECDLAIVGAVNLILTPALHRNFSEAGMLAEDGRCKVFSDQANGYVRSEGCIVLLLSRLSIAKLNNYPILATLESYAVNHDGRTSGITVPSGPAQTDVIKTALKKAGIKPDQIDYLECHGTGTSLGDPIELKALERVFSERLSSLSIGSVKANLGHLEIAAGLAGLVKLLLVLHHQKIPAQIYSRPLSQYLDWPTSVLNIPEALEDLPSKNQKSWVGLSAFGFSGTNVHLILSSSPSPVLKLPRPSVNFNLSHFEVPYLARRSEKQLAACLEIHPEIYLENWEILEKSMFEKTFDQILKSLENPSVQAIKIKNDYENLLEILENKCCEFLNLNLNLNNNLNRENKIIPLYSKLVKSVFASADFLMTQRKLDLKNLISWELLEKKYPDFRLEINLLEQCLTALPQVLSGEIKATDLLFKGGESSIAHQLYHRTSIGSYYNEQVLSVLKAYCEIGGGFYKNKKLKILEIGAGSGATTRCLLPYLLSLYDLYDLEEDSIEYYFTDISAYFLEQAKQRFSGYKFLKFNLLDISQPIHKNSLFFENMDCVIAANVVHATPKIASTLSHIYQCLKTSGIFILRECTRPTLTADLTFGLSEGWWNFSEDPIREEYPLLQVPQWLKVLSQTGFCSPTALCEESESYEQVMVSEKTQLIPVESVKNILIESKNIPHLSGLIESLDFAFSYRLIFCFSGEDFGENIEANNVPIGFIGSIWQAYFLEIIKALQCLNTGYFKNLKIKKLAFMLEDVKNSAPQKGLLKGLARVISIEYPQYGFVCIERTNGKDSELLSLLDQPRIIEEREIKLLEKEVFVRRLIQKKFDQAPPKFDPQAAYLILGATGGLAIQTIDWLISQGAKNLVLASRHIETAKNQIKQREGVRYSLATLDLANEEQVKNLFQKFGKIYPPLKGIFHAAGVGGDCLINQIQENTLPEMFQTKVQGTYLLHQYSLGHPIDYFVVYSSVMATWGAREKAHYAAVNQFSVELMAMRQAQGLPGLAIDWGPWEGAGMLNKKGLEDSQKVGLKSVKAEFYLKAMGQALSENLSHVVIAAVDWDIFSQAYGVYYKFYLVDQVKVKKAEAIKINLGIDFGAGPHFPDDTDSEDSENLKIIEGRISRILSDVLGFQSSDQINLQKGFYDQGLDSLMALNFVEKLKSLCLLNPSDLFNYPNVKNLAAEICSRKNIKNIKTKSDTNDQSGSQSSSDLDRLLAEIEESIKN